MPDARESAPTRRFFRSACIRPEGDGFVLTLDDRPARTPGRIPLVLPTRALGDAVAAEWDAQRDIVDPRTMPLTRLANSAIDGVAPELVAVRADIVRYAGSDLVAYRAGEPERLVRLQSAAWDPVIAFARESLGATIVLSEGVTFVEQPAGSLQRIAARLAQETSPFAVAALHVMTTLAGSALIALMHVGGQLDARAAWAAAHVDEAYQESLWGLDAEAAERRRGRELDFLAASRMYGLSRPEA